MDRRLILADRVVFTCQHSGACCRGDWRIGVEPESHARLRDMDWSGLPAAPSGERFVPARGPLEGGQSVEVARRPDGACVFLTPETRCAIHERLGGAAKPQACREFPYQFVDTPDGVVVGVSYACTAVRGGHGRPLAEQQAEIRGLLATSRHVPRLPDPIVLFGALPIAWPDYRALEAALLDLLDDHAVPLPVALVAGSAAVGVAVALAEVQRRDAAESREAGRTLAGGLHRLREDRCRTLVDLASAAAPPRRATLAPLALLYTWLEMSRRPLSRSGLLVALVRNLHRFGRGRGRVPDLVAGRGLVTLEDVPRVGCDLTRPDLDTFVRGYWRHVVVRKSLLPMHGVFRGYQTLLLLHAFTRWTARVHALRRGADEVGLQDVHQAVRLVEQRFVLHARVAGLFELSPALTVMADRLYRRPAFVRACAL